MRVFAVLYCYPPLLVPATMCYVKLVIGLKELGHDVEVLTIVPESFRPPGPHPFDPSMNSLIPDGVRRHEVWSWEKNRILNAIRDIGVLYRLGYRLWEPRKKEWVFPALRYVNGLDFSRFDAVLSCSQPHSNHMIGLHLKRRHGIPWIAYLSDPWSDMPWHQHRFKAVAHYNRRIEREVIESADTVLFTSQETVELVMKKYPPALRDKVGVLPHSFVPEWYGLGRTAAKSGHARIKILHTGHFYGERTPLPVFAALERLNLETPLKDQLHLTCVGSMQESYRRYVTERGLESYITVLETVPYLDSLALMTESDYLLVLDAPLRKIAESVFLPSKLVDYLGSGKPVIGVTPKRGTTARVLQETGNLWCDVENDEEIYRLFAGILSGSGKASLKRERVMEYHYLATSKRLHDALNRIVAKTATAK